VFRSLQLKKDGINLGSHKSSLNFLSTSFSNSYDEELSRSRAIILPYQEFIHRTELFLNGTYPPALKSTIGKYQQTIAGGASGVVIALPHELDASLHAAWALAEHTLLSNEVQIPIYFVFDSDMLQNVIKNVEKTTTTTSGSFVDSFLGDNYQLVISAKEGSPIKTPSGVNLQGWLPGADSSSSPTVAIFAHYDSFAAAPKLAEGASSSISGTIMLMELARTFHRLYSTARHHAKYNLLFVLTSGEEFNYLGSKNWLRDIDDNIAKSLDFILCLDSVGTASLDEPLYLHTSRPPKDPTAKRLYESFTQTAQQMGRSFEVNQQKVDFSNQEEPWQHEHFSKQKYLASTISSKKSPSPALGNSHIFDAQTAVNVTVVRENLRLIAESLAKFIYRTDIDDLRIFEHSFDFDPTFIKVWFSTLASNPRMFPYVSEEITANLEQTLGVYCDLVKRTFTLEKDSNYVFFSSADSVELNAHVVKPFLFDVILALITASYLSGLYFAVKNFQILA